MNYFLDRNKKCVYLIPIFYCFFINVDDSPTFFTFFLFKHLFFIRIT
jgi:hypothetical protein